MGTEQGLGTGKDKVNKCHTWDIAIWKTVTGYCVRHNDDSQQHVHARCSSKHFIKRMDSVFGITL